MKHHLRIALRLLSLTALLLALSAIASAQEVTASIVGSVKDSTGAAVQGATVTITDADKKVVVRTIQTNDAGEYSVPNLSSGFYDVTVEAPGFKKHLESRVKLDVGEHHPVNVSLEAGNIAEVVTVDASPVTVELTTPAVSTTINGDQVRQLSINNRNFIQLVALAPGVTNDLEDFMPTGTNNPETQVVVRGLISVNGARNTSNTFTVDGADVTDRGSNLTIQAYPSVDSIGEFKVLRSLYPAESGRSGGGQINIVTRSGGEKLHGSAFEFIRNEAFNANDFLTNRNKTAGVDSQGRAKKRPFRYNNYGFTIGGPGRVLQFWRRERTHCQEDKADLFLLLGRTAARYSLPEPHFGGPNATTEARCLSDPDLFEFNDERCGWVWLHLKPAGRNTDKQPGPGQWCGAAIHKPNLE